MRTVYLAGPIAGMTADAAQGWRSKAIEYLYGYDIRGVSPLRNEPPVNGMYGDAESWVGRASADGKAISAKNLFDVRNCDLSLIYLPKVANDMRPSYGTILELGWAFAYLKPIILVSDDPAVMAHPCIDVCAGWKVATLEEGLSTAVQILHPFV